MEERFKNDVEDFQNAESRIMGEFKGTKGKWCTSPHDPTVVIADIESSAVLAEFLDDRSWLSASTEEEAIANAQLTAAAPELLVELYQMTLLLKALPENDSEMSERIESAEKTINKALGL